MAMRAPQPAFATRGAPFAPPAVLDGDAPEPVVEPEVEDEPDAFAFAWYAPKLFGPDSMAFAEKTMPAAQWLAGFVCLQ